jgi:hypothetical protein
MSVSRIGALAAILGGMVWVVAAVLAWGDEDLDTALYYAGFALLVVAFAAMGYALVATAPVWLRAVVTVATPLLGTMIWLILRDSIADAYVSAVVGGVLLLVGGGIALGRAASSAPKKAPPPQRGRRAAR